MCFFYGPAPLYTEGLKAHPTIVETIVLVGQSSSKCVLPSGRLFFLLYSDFIIHVATKTQKLLIDQFHVVRYCFLNNALSLYGSYDCT